MYWVSYFYLCWVNFWRLPVSVHTERTQSREYQRKVDFLRLLWLAVVISLALVGQLVVLVVGIIFMTFLTFMFLDEG